MDVALYHESLDHFCEAVKKKGAAVLDIACGPGNLTHYLLQKRPDFRVHGIDLAPRMIALAQRNNPTATFEVMDGREIGNFRQPFDAVICGFGLPYLSKKEVEQLVADAAQLLVPDGVFYLSTMEGDDHKSGYHSPSDGGDQQLYIHYHQADFLQHVLAENGFSILEIQRIQNPEEKDPDIRDLVILAQKAA